jgi:predicted DCC family thiol-disulfide oxidoreductase YuxK
VSAPDARPILDTASFAAALPNRIIFFDGECVLCNGAVKVILEADEAKVFSFASLQGQTAARLQGKMFGFPSALETIVYLENERVYLRSQAVFKIAKLLPFPWRLLSLFSVLPIALCDFVYCFVARVRYAVFGRRETCMVPTPDDRQRFLP